VIVEAMSTGIAVVATDCPWGPGEIIESGKNGFLVSPRNPEKLAEGIVKVLLSPESRQLVAAAGRQRAKDFTSKRIADQYADLIQSTIASRVPTRVDEGIQ
jgi:glycosyltransferase involved in cell wall biosynthesis